MKKMREKYKINEIAKIFNISRRTLIYYDEIDLFKPAYVDDKNSYRYYSGHQIYVLRFIIALKNSGFSLNEIKEYTTCNDIEEIQNFLKNKIVVMEEKIKNLHNSIEIAKRKSEELERVKSSEGLKPMIVTDINLRVVVVQVEKPYKYMQTEEAYKELAKIENQMKLEDKKHIAVVESKNVKKLDVYPLKLVGSIIPKGIKDDMVSNITEKKCVSITHKDSFENLKNSYRKLIDFIEENSYKIVGDAIEVSNKEKIQLEKGVGEVIKIYIPIE